MKEKIKEILFGESLITLRNDIFSRSCMSTIESGPDTYTKIGPRALYNNVIQDCARIY